MDIIGEVTPQIWERIKYTANQENIMQELHNPSCPYIPVIEVNNNQLLVITGRHTHGNVEISIQEVRRPNKEAEKQPIPEKDWRKAREMAQQLLLKARKL